MNTDKIIKIISKHEKRLKNCEDEYLRLNDSIKTVSQELKTKRTQDKSIRVANMRLSTHKTYMNVDLMKRPCDRTQDIRSYSQIDKNLWKYDDLREWFQKYSQDEVQDNFVPYETGYTLKLDDIKDNTV